MCDTAELWTTWTALSLETCSSVHNPHRYLKKDGHIYYLYNTQLTFPRVTFKDEMRYCFKGSSSKPTHLPTLWQLLLPDSICGQGGEPSHIPPSVWTLAGFRASPSIPDAHHAAFKMREKTYSGPIQLAVKSWEDDILPARQSSYAQPTPNASVVSKGCAHRYLVFTGFWWWRILEHWN